MNTGLVSSDAHGTTECINFLNQMSLADTTNSRVTTHLSKCVYIMSKQQCAGTGARGRQRRFSACMAATDHDDIKFCWVLHGATHSLLAFIIERTTGIKLSASPCCRSIQPVLHKTRTCKRSFLCPL